LENLDQAYLLVVFELYDESMEVLSKVVSPGVVVNTVREVASDEDVRLTSD